MKKIYTRPNIERMMIEIEDVIRTSVNLLKTTVNGTTATGLQSVEYTDIFEQRNDE